MIDHTTRFRPSSTLVSLVAFDLSTAFSPRENLPVAYSKAATKGPAMSWNSPDSRKYRPLFTSKRNWFLPAVWVWKGEFETFPKKHSSSKPNQKMRMFKNDISYKSAFSKKQKRKKNIADFQRLKGLPSLKLLKSCQGSAMSSLSCRLFPDFNQSKTPPPGNPEIPRSFSISTCIASVKRW